MAAQWTATPNSITEVATGITTSAGNPLQALYAKMREGNIADLSGGAYARPKFTKAYRQPGVYVTLRGPAWSDPSHAQIKPNRAVGGGDTINLSTDVGDLRFVRVDIEGDDRSAILSDLKSVHRNVVLQNCKIHGTGSAYDPSWKSDTKWGILGNWDADWEVVDCEFSSIFQEHFAYLHNRQGAYTFKNTTFKHAGRTAVQDIARKYDGPVGMGDMLIDGCRMEDCCLEGGGGGSFITNRGGYPNSSLTIKNTVIRGGCDPLLAFHTTSITGALVVDEEKTNGVPTVHPGGLGKCSVLGCDIEFGTVHHGSGSAVRPILRFAGPLGLLEIADTRCHVTRAPTDSPIALEIGTQVQSVKISGNNDFLGQCIYHGTRYPSLAAMMAANPETVG